MTAAALASAVAVLGLVTCGEDELSANTGCDDFLAAEPAAQQQAVGSVGVELGARDAGNPLFVGAVQAACGSAPQNTLGEVIDRSPKRGDVIADEATQGSGFSCQDYVDAGQRGAYDQFEMLQAASPNGVPLDKAAVENECRAQPDRPLGEVVADELND